MKTTLKTAAAVAGGIVGCAATAAGIGTLLWNRSTARAVERLAPHAPAKPARVFSSEQLAGLPDPVARYFMFVLTPGRPLARRARIEHVGEFRSALDAPWSPFTSVEHFTADPPGFLWDAKIRMAPLTTVRVRDSYLDGRGSMLGKVAGLIPVVDQSGSPELASGALQRYLAEAVWLPAALLPENGVTWEAVDATSARATLTHAGTTVSLVFRFGESGEIVSTSTPGRFRDVNGRGVLTPWEGVHRRYEEIGCVRVPTEGEVAWILPEGKLTYWRGRIVRAQYE
ncbi:MAG TPA: DUF6544 family protein [Thermoanaerobaculia bacterium]|nr:DUF6544 family protein [Thermoanaerobaculia bacterium]